MIKKQLHIVSFDVPYPADYGGAIDVFYKIKALKELGIEIYLHVFDYGRGKPVELENYCKKVFYYPREKKLINFFSTIPFIAKTRNNQELIKQLKTIDAPILFEGLHTTFSLLNETFYNRKIAVRAHNIEHDYYLGLFKSETNLFKKIFFLAESLKLKNYEPIVKKVDFIFTISPFEQQYFNHQFPDKAHYIPVFHPNKANKAIEQKGSKILYHGDLRIADNIKSVQFLINVFKDFPHKLTIASSFENSSIQQKIAKQKNIEFVKISAQNTMDELFKQAQINILLTNQKTGIKLKLINALHQGRFVIANSYMIEDTGLEDLCVLANGKQNIRESINKLFESNFNDKIIEFRKEKLQNFDPLKSAKKIVEILY